MKRSVPLFPLVCLVGASLLCSYRLPFETPVESPARADSIRFDRDIRPLLASRCFACHGPDEGRRKAGLRLDRREEAVRDLGGYQAIAPGHPDKSEVLLRVTRHDAERMPPPKAGPSLTPGEIELLERWIASGAEWEEHWSFRTPSRPRPPEVEDIDWVRNPVDRFVLATLEEEGLQPSPDADRRTLARRLSFDLVGLPPTAEAVESFLLEPDDEAYERFVEQRLSSPHYAERMTMFWLDAVRYADTVGYHGDQEWSTWPYRDYVIDAFRSEMPFDRFTVEQLAGDLLPDATLPQRVASTYNRLSMLTAEGGAQAEEYLVKYAADRVRATSSAWLGLTMACAECHDHKFDPIKSRDFYSFAAFFADIQEQGVYIESALKGPKAGRWDPEMLVPDSEQQRELDSLDESIAELEAVLRVQTPELLAAQALWEEEIRARLDSLERQDHVWLDDELAPGVRRFGTWRFLPASDAPVLSGRFSRLQRGAGPQAHAFVEAPMPLGPMADDVFFAYVWLDPEAPPRSLMVQVHAGAWAPGVYWGEPLLEGAEQSAADAPLRKGSLPAPGEWVRLELTLDDVGLVPGAVVDGMAFHQFGGIAYWDKAGLYSTAADTQGDALPPEVEALLYTPASERDEEQRSTVAAHYLSIAPALEPVRRRLAQIQQVHSELLAAIPRTLATVSVEPRVTRVLPRGDWMDASGEIVEPAPPAFLESTPADPGRRATRLDLARWMVSPDNPLTARVFVNRLWQTFLGEGLCRTPDNFGYQGQFPTHPELLDWLAVEFIESGWDVKHMIRLIVTSNTYRQASVFEDERRSRDPSNRLLARQIPRRLDAELIRDNALSISGLLSTRIGGPSVKPYQPPGYWSQLNFPARTWEASQGSDLYRRGLYTFWCRTFLYPSFQAFDAPTREQCTMRRAESNTPLQALVLLNDPVYVEAARALAEKTMEEGGASAEGRIRWAWRRTLCRAPSDEEVEVLLALFRRHEREFRRDPEAAVALAATGQSRGDEAMDPVEVAAWTSVSRALLNLHETITRP